MPVTGEALTHPECLVAAIDCTQAQTMIQQDWKARRVLKRGGKLRFEETAPQQIHRQSLGAGGAPQSPDPGMVKTIS